MNKALSLFDSLVNGWGNKAPPPWLVAWEQSAILVKYRSLRNVQHFDLCAWTFKIDYLRNFLSFNINLYLLDVWRQRDRGEEGALDHLYCSEAAHEEYQTR